jgi:DNA recombination protein RmuC
MHIFKLNEELYNIQKNFINTSEELEKKKDECEVSNKEKHELDIALKEQTTISKNCANQIHTMDKREETFRKELKDTNETLTKKLEELAAEQEKFASVVCLKDDITEKNKKIEYLKEQLAAKQTTIETLELASKKDLANLKEQIELLENNKKELKIAFENLANKIFEEKNNRFKISSNELLKPLKDQITTFRQKIEHIYNEESTDRGVLKNEISNLKTLNERIGKDALNLTKALKGESKTQGIWGEMILEKILEESGLENGREYETQVAFKDESGKRYIPDVIVHLPDQKDVVVDSKVSLTAYEKYSSSDTEKEKSEAIKQHILSCRNHINELAQKNYDSLPGIRSLNFVLMFVPIEPAFLVALKESPNLFQEAFAKNIIIVCPSTLMMSLRTIQNLWSYEDKNQNAQKIADQAAGLYDKFVGLIDSLETVGKHLTKAEESYTNAHKQLTSGRGNLIDRAEKLRDLGVTPKKRISPKLIDDATVQGSEPMIPTMSNNKESTITH